jgi:hypothetical protein
MSDRKDTPEEAAARKEAEDRARDIGRELSQRCPEGWGFTLFMFSFGEKGHMVYISNSERKLQRKALREYLDKTKQPGDDK